MLSIAAFLGRPFLDTRLIPMTKVKRNWLPRCLLMDEFRSLKIKSVPTPFLVWMAILENYWIFFLHEEKALVSYFMQFERRARLKVKVIVMDMNAYAL